MDRVYSIQVDFKYTEKIITDVAFKQFDYGTSYLDINLTFEDEPISLTDEVIVAVFKNSKGNLILDENNKTVKSFGYIVNMGEGRVLIQIPNEILKVKGTCTCELVSFLSDGIARRTTQAFNFKIVSSITELEDIVVPDELLSIIGTFKCGTAFAGFTRGNSIQTLSMDDLFYEKTLWEDGVTLVNAFNLNKIEDSIEKMFLNVSEIKNDLSTTKDTVSNLQSEIDTLHSGISNLNGENILYFTEADTSITSVKDALDKLLYVPLTLNFSCRTPLFERGTTVNEIWFDWSYNKKVSYQKFNGETIDSELRSYKYTQPFTSNKNFTLVANDGKKEYNKSVNVTFSNGRYWGVSSSNVYDSNFIKSLNKELNESRVKTFTVNCGEGQYVFYCFPSKAGTPTFTVGGFKGGFIKVDTIAFENNLGFIENYDIWKSENSNLGSITVVVG